MLAQSAARVTIAALISLFGIAAVEAACRGCSCRGGPGFRMPNGKCASWKQVNRVCGVPNSLRCKDERPEAVKRAHARSVAPVAAGVLGISSAAAASKSSACDRIIAAVVNKTRAKVKQRDGALTHFSHPSTSRYSLVCGSSLRQIALFADTAAPGASFVATLVSAGQTVSGIAAKRIREAAGKCQAQSVHSGRIAEVRLTQKVVLTCLIDTSIASAQYRIIDKR